MTRAIALLATPTVSISGAACTSTGPESGDEIEVAGVVGFHEEPAPFEAPDTVDEGQTFTVSVRTWGGGCVGRGPTRVNRDGSTVRIEPIDIEVVAEVCTAGLARFLHTADVTLDSPGTATLRVVGRRLPGDEVVTLERILVAR